MKFDLSMVPFSTKGSYFAFSHLYENKVKKSGLYLRTVKGDISVKEIFRFEVTHQGKCIDFEEIASPALLELKSEYGCIKICMSEPETIRIIGNGLGLKIIAEYISYYDNVIHVAPNMWEYNSNTLNMKLMLQTFTGHTTVDAPWDGVSCEKFVADFLPDNNTGYFEMSITEFKSVWTKKENIVDFYRDVAAVEDSFKEWLNKTITLPLKYSEGRELAAYINWSSLVNPKGILTRPSMFMSKNWMLSVWSWDHCFNAMGLFNDIDLALDQLMLMFDLQDETGALPDYVNDSRISYNFCKPPIHGWVLNWIMNRNRDMKQEHIELIYGPLCKWTNWWFEYRDNDKDGIPQYNHGNDSGWDNSTVFLESIPVESPDLCAFLVLQMETLSRLAISLGLPGESMQWGIKAKELLLKLICEFWNGEKFIARDAISHKVIDTDSLMHYLPLVLGNRLPSEIIKKMASDLMKDQKKLTAFGLATEATGSNYYRTNGYWRGPIWAPPTMIIVDGLMEAGEIELAKDIAKKFCDMAFKNGMAENYDALSGKSLCDTAYTWSASIFLILGGLY